VGRGKEVRLSESIGSLEVSSCQQAVIMEMGSIDLIDCQVGSRKIPCCQVGKGEQMRLTESLMNSEVSSDQQEELIQEDQKRILMIGGIKVFLPYSPVEANMCVAEAAIEDRQLAETVMEKEMEQISEAAQREEKEHSKEWLKIFSQEIEGEIDTALKMTAREEEEHADKMLTPWDMELEMLEDWLNHPEAVDDCHEETIMQMLAEEHSEESLRNFNQGVEQMMTAALRFAAEGESEFHYEEKLEEPGDAPAGELAEEKLSKEEAEKRLSDKTAKLNFAEEWQVEATEEEDGMGDLVDLPICREEVQWSRLQKESQLWE
jgi:hypothetical protein